MKYLLKLLYLAVIGLWLYITGYEPDTESKITNIAEQYPESIQKDLKILMSTKSGENDEHSLPELRGKLISSIKLCTNEESPVYGSESCRDLLATVKANMETEQPN